MSKGGCGKSPLRMYDMERYMLHFVSRFMSSSDFAITLQDVEELCSACQFCEQPLICVELMLAFLWFLTELQIILLMLHTHAFCLHVVPSDFLRKSRMNRLMEAFVLQTYFKHLTNDGWKSFCGCYYFELEFCILTVCNLATWTWMNMNMSNRLLMSPPTWGGNMTHRFHLNV